MSTLNVRVEGTMAEMKALIVLIEAETTPITYIRYGDNIQIPMKSASTVATLAPLLITFANTAT